MARPVVLSNGEMFVGLNEHGLVHDFYFPYIGLDNLTNARSLHHKLGVWVDGSFSWVDDGSWEISVNFEEDALISSVHLYSSSLQVGLTTKDFVSHDSNVFIRSVCVDNSADNAREVRVFFHQVFQISRAGRADTALFVPGENYIYDYRGSIGLLTYGQHEDGRPFDQFAIGNYGIEGKEGTFRDAEDGVLSGSAVEHGGVDSVIGFTLQLEAKMSKKINYWIAASHSQTDAEALHAQTKHISVDRLIDTTRSYWNTWLSTSSNKIHAVDKKYLIHIKKSLMLIKAHCDKRGGIIASGDSSIYNYGRDYYSYVWPRDAAFALWPLIRVGYTEEAKNFFLFCKDILHKDGYLMHKYQADKAVGSTWHPLVHDKHPELAIQEDETAVVLYVLGEYYAHSKDDVFVESIFESMVRPMANFLSTFIDEKTGLPHASYDLWEEKFLTHTYTVAIVYQALVVATELAEVFAFPEDKARWQKAAAGILKSRKLLLSNNIYRKGFLLQENGELQFDDTIDVSSFYGVMMFGLYETEDSAFIHESAKKIMQVLSQPLPIGGVARHENDYYFLTKQQYPGNPWFVTTLWMSQYYMRVRQPETGLKLLDWVLQYALPSGILSEQLDPEDGSIVSVTPLVWSHAELVNTVLDASHIE